MLSGVGVEHLTSFKRITTAEREEDILSSFFGAFSDGNRDPRTSDWPLMGSVWPTLAICATYVFCATWAGPAFMHNRRKFELTGAMNAYNLVQVVGNALLLYGYCANGWMTTYDWLCEDVDWDPRPGSAGYNMAVVLYAAFIFRIIDFADTAFFVLRKKTEHVSSLQVIHHCAMPIFGWTIVAFFPGGHESLGGPINSLVHCVMYTYYFLAALGPRYKKYLWWKRYLTSLQMVQFVAVLAKSLVNLSGVAGCRTSWQLSVILVFLTILFLALFSQFYRKEYVAKRVSRKEE